jgi:hypothetical protein
MGTKILTNLTTDKEVKTLISSQTIRNKPKWWTSKYHHQGNPYQLWPDTETIYNLHLGNPYRKVETFGSSHKSKIENTGYRNYQCLWNYSSRNSTGHGKY